MCGYGAMIGRDMAQAVSHRTLTARFRAQVI
jgi:hypothetical protein